MATRGKVVKPARKATPAKKPARTQATRQRRPLSTKQQLTGYRRKLTK